MTRLDSSLFEVVCISPRNHMLFTPLLASSAVGTLDFRSITEPIEESCPSVPHLRAHVQSLDAEACTLQAEAEADSPISQCRTFSLPFDFALLAVGARPGTFGVPGVEDFAFFLKELSDARSIRARILRNISAAALPSASPEERRALLSFVIVGGGPTGIEFSAELFDFLSQDALRLHPELVAQVRVTVLEAGSSVLSSFEAGLRDYAAASLRGKSIDVRTGAKVVRVEAAAVQLADGSSLPCGLCIWNTGLQPSPLVRALPASTFAKDAWGHLLVSPSLRALSSSSGSPSLRRIFALGDAAAISGQSLPPTAQVAEQQGFFLAEALNTAAAAAAAAGASGRGRGGSSSVEATASDIAASLSEAPFSYVHPGALASLGMGGGISDFSKRALGSSPDPLKGTTFTGAAANVIWKAAYLSKLGSWKNRVQVPLDWLKAALLGRDTTIF